MHGIQYHERWRETCPSKTGLAQKGHIQAGVMKQPDTSARGLEQRPQTCLQWHTQSHITIQKLMNCSTTADRLLCIDKDMPVGAQAYSAIVDMGPTNGNNLILSGIQTGQLKIDGDQWCVGKLRMWSFRLFVMLETEKKRMNL